MAWKIGVGERVSFLGHTPNPESVLQQSDLLVLPTLYDPSANVCLEALACGVPVVTSGNNGMCEILPFDWMTVADPKDAYGFALSAQKALHKSGLGHKCRELAMTFSQEKSYEQLFHVLFSESNT